MKTLSKRNVSIIDIRKDCKVLKMATSPLTPICHEHLFLEVMKYCFIPRSGAIFQRYISYMVRNKNYLPLKIVFSSLMASHYNKIQSQPAIMHQILAIPKQTLKMRVCVAHGLIIQKGFLQFPYKIFLYSQTEVDLS